MRIRRMRCAGPGRALEFDGVPLGIENVERGSFSFRAVAHAEFAHADAGGMKMSPEGRLVERLQAQAEVIEVATFSAGGGTAGLPSLPSMGTRSISDRPARNCTSPRSSCRFSTGQPRMRA